MEKFKILDNEANFDEGLVDPIEYHKLLENLKELSPEQLIHISALIRDLNNVSNRIGRRD